VKKFRNAIGMAFGRKSRIYV